MELEYLPDPEAGDAFPVTIFNIEQTEPNDFGTQLKWFLTDVDARTRIMWTPDVITPRNRLGRAIKSLFGELRKVDTDELIGMTATLVYVPKKGATDGSVVADILKPRKKAKGEDPAADVKLALEREEGFNRPDSAPF